jgi:integrase
MNGKSVGLSDTATSDTGTGRLTDNLVRKLPVPAIGSKITYDRGEGAVRRFGARITAHGARAFVLRYSAGGRERLLTIGSYPDWSVVAAREEAKRLKREIDLGRDPLGERIAEREAPTVNELCDRYLEEHAVKKRSEAEDRRMIDRTVRPELGTRKVAEIIYDDINRLHRKLTTTSARKKPGQRRRDRGTRTAGGAPYAANRQLALLSKMFSLAILWGMRKDNPTKGVERNPEQSHERYLKGDELRRVTAALAAHPSQSAANAIRLLLLTGARRGEVLAATWDQFDLELGVWTKPSSHTKQKREHRVPLSAPARQLLAEMHENARRRARQQKQEPSPYLFPGRASDGAMGDGPTGDGPMRDLKRSWIAICRAAELQGVRVHDLRHSFASVLVNAGQSLPMIGALLGHTNPATTAKYAHLYDDPLRAAAERVGAVVTASASAKPAGELVRLGRR